MPSIEEMTDEEWMTGLMFESISSRHKWTDGMRLKAVADKDHWLKYKLRGFTPEEALKLDKQKDK